MEISVWRAKNAELKESYAEVVKSHQESRKIQEKSHRKTGTSQN